MVFSIRHTGLESPEAVWRRNLREDSMKLGEELHGKFAKRPDMDAGRIAAGIIRPHEAKHFERVALYGSLRGELPKTFRDGNVILAQSSITAITNRNTAVTYTKLDDAIYLASSGDEIMLPAGCGANNGSFVRYSDFAQLDSFGSGYTNGSNAMVIGNPSQASTSATYLSIVGIPSSNSLSSVSWANTSGGQLTVVISGSAITTYRKGMFVRLSGCTNTGTGGAGSAATNPLTINRAFPVFSVSGSTLVLSAPVSVGVYGTIAGTPVLNNDRAQISPPVGYLTTALDPGDTTIVLDSASDFRTGGTSIYAWGNGDTTWQTVQMNYTGVSGNTLTGVTGSGSLSTTVPIGSPIIQIIQGSKGIFTPAATNATGITMSNLEIWGGAAYPSGGGIFQWTADPGTAQGSLTLNNVFLHDNMMGIRPGSCPVGSGVFLDVFNSEIWRSSNFTDRNHNIYIDFDIFLFQNSISHFIPGVHLVKSRSRTNYILYSRTYGEWGSAANTFGNRTTNYDFPNGGLVYLIGSVLSASEQDNGSLVRYQEETGSYPTGGIAFFSGYNGASGTSNATAEIYAVNSNLLGPANGTGYSGASSFANNAPITIGFPGLANPEIASVTTTSGGSLTARAYWTCTTLLDSGGNETLPSCMNGADGSAALTAYQAIGANHLAVVSSPIPRTGAVTYNNYMAHADPTIFWKSAVIPPATGPNQFFYDGGLTQPVCVVNSGGSQPASFVYGGVVYVFSDGTESVNFALGGMLFFQNPVAGQAPGFNTIWSASTTPNQTNAFLISIPVNNLLTIKSPPSIAGATGWYPLVTVTAYNGGGNYLFGRAPLSRQTFTPIAIGTDWVQSGAFIQADTAQYNLYRQNASPITVGIGWTEPTTGLTNLNPTNLLKWYRRGSVGGGSGFSEWYAVAQGSFTNYVVKAYNTVQFGNYQVKPANGTVTTWSGAIAGPFPFDADYPVAAVTSSATSTTATTAATNTAIIASFRGAATAGAGWTQQSSLSFIMVESKIVSSSQTGLAVTQVGSGASQWLVDALSGTITQRGSSVTSSVNTNVMSFTIPSIVTGDVLILTAGIGNGPELLAVDPLAWGPPCQNQAIGAAPIGSIVNCISAYYNPTGGGSAGGGFGTGGWVQTFPGVVLYGGVSYPTVSAFNLQSDVFNGSTFAAPLVGAVWTDATNFDFTLAGSSPAVGVGVVPGTGHGGYSLTPVYQTSMIGTPTPGQPIAALTARTDSGLTLGAIGAGSSPTTPGPRMRWMRFGWDWRLGLAILAVATVERNPTVTRRRVLALPDASG